MKYNCTDCDNMGWVDSNNESGEDEIQRCDTCKVYSDDLQANAAKNNARHWERLSEAYPAIECNA